MTNPQAYDATVYYLVASVFSWVTPWPWWLDTMFVGWLTAFMVHVFNWADKRRRGVR
jgi:hypothetical protein